MTATLNAQPKGDLFVILRDDGDFLVKGSALQEAGIQQVAGTPVDFSGERYVSLRSIKGLSYRFNESTLTLEMEADPTLLSKRKVDLAPVRNSGVIYPTDNSLFLNYNLGYHATGQSFGSSDFSLANELGIRVRDTLFLSNTLFTEKPGQSQFVRLNTSLIRDDRQTLRRMIAGDFPASSGELGSQINMGGVSFSKLYRMDPYLIRTPLFNFNGLLSRPSDVDIYVNGVKVRSDHLPPGEFEIRNLEAISGAQNIEVVVRDPFGREQRYVSPFYFSDNILRQGLHEYSYNVGSLRENFGLASNDYAHFVFSAFHRYGLSDSINVGARSEGGNGLFNAALQSTLRLTEYGLVRFEAAASNRQNTTGAAGLVGYSYQSSSLQGNLTVQSFSEGYRTLSDTVNAGQRRKFGLLAATGYTLPHFGSLAVQYVKSNSFNGEGNSNITLSWSKQLWRRALLSASYQRTIEPQRDNIASAYLTWGFAPGLSAIASVQADRQSDHQTLEVRKDPPIGEGVGWSARMERAESNSSPDNYTINPTVQYNAQRGILRGDYSAVEGGGSFNQDLLLSLSGSMVYLGNTFALARPVTDSFALMKVGDGEGVRLYANGQTLGRSDSQGRVIVPELSSFYENQVSMEDKDVPIDYLMQKVRMLVSPPFRSGSCLYFPLQKYLAVTGSISLAGPEKVEPLANSELTLTAPVGKVTFWTGDEGEFYFDNSQAQIDFLKLQGCEALSNVTTAFLTPGSYPVDINRNGQIFRVQLTIPKVEGATLDLGKIVFPAPMPATVHKPELVKTPPEERKIPDSSLTAPGTTVHVPSASTATPPVTEQEADKKSSLAVLNSPYPEKTGDLPVTEIHFKFGSDDFASEEEKMVLLTFAHCLKWFPHSKLLIDGYTDQIGSQRYNLGLGMRRGQRVALFLQRHGIGLDRIKGIRSHGKRKLSCHTLDENCRSKNRRVLLTVLPD